MLLPKEPVDWSRVWPDLLQGLGAGLLHYEGSRLAQAALLGLEAFDAAQARRKSQDVDRSTEDHEHQTGLPWRGMTAAELAAFQRSSPEQKSAIAQEAAEVGLPADQSDYEHDPLPGNSEHSYGDPDLRLVPLAFRRQPLSASPFADWPLKAILPFGRDGRVKLSTLRR